MIWPNHDLLDLLNIEVPVIQAPMAGANGPEMAIAVSQTGGLGSLPCAMLSPAQADAGIRAIRDATERPYNVNFFCHEMPLPDADRDLRWRDSLAAYHAELGATPSDATSAPARLPFDDAMCEVIEAHQPPVISFHFGLPPEPLFARVKMAGCTVLSSATSVDEARWLEACGCDAIIAQGAEAGGHRGTFLSDPIQSAATQTGTIALLPQIADAVSVPVIAAGGIADGRGVAAALILGAAGVQVGTAYLHTPEATIGKLHREALGRATDNGTALTNLFSGRPARGIMNRLMEEQGPISASAPAFPTAGARLAPIRQAAEAAGRPDFTSLWAGQAAPLHHAMDAAGLTRRLADEARVCLMGLSG